LIPALSATGHLPPGRHPATIEEIHDRFVGHSDFSSSTSRAAIFDGFASYLLAWDHAGRTLSATLLRGMWVAGSFVSAELDPSDIDVSPLYDEAALRASAGMPGIGQAKRLFEHRKRVVQEFRVEPFAVPWHAIPSTLLPERLEPAMRDALAVRGGVDSWWGRVRPHGDRDQAPVAPTALADRGFLEVFL
jgi:hypothetical protein